MAALAGAFYVVVAQLRFDQGRVMTVAYPVAALALGAFGALAVDYFTETREKRRMRVLFGRFVPESVVDDVISRADDDLRLEGVRLDATVLFSDLRDFTGFAQGLEPRRVIDVLNRYLGEMSEAILDHGGTLVSYMGDGIMAVFGAPIEQDDHADRALAAAREMLEVRLPRFNAWLAETDVDRGFKMGIGLNSGPVMSGNVGSQRRLEYTAVGDTTNTAARLEGLTKGTAHQLFVSDATRERLHHGAEDLIEHGELSVRGREATVLVWVVSEQTLRGDGEPG
jgi:adenylate cyclase